MFMCIATQALICVVCGLLVNFIIYDITKLLFLLLGTYVIIIIIITRTGSHITNVICLIIFGIA